MLKIGICDDERVQRDSLRKILSVALELKNQEYRIYEFGSGEELCQSAVEGYDILFLDIEMKALNGIETARRIRSRNRHTVILFVTAYPDYVFQGYEVHALNYILKPYRREKMIGVLEEALEQLELKKERFYLIETKQGTIKLNLNEVIYFKSNGHRIAAVTKEGETVFYGKLEKTEKELPAFFARSHQSYLVNMHFVTAVQNASVTVQVGKRQEKFPVSRKRCQNLFIQFSHMMLEV